MPTRRADQAATPVLPAVSNAGFFVALGIVVFYLLLIGMAYFGLREPGVMMGGNEMSKPRALFTAVNAATLTGFRQSIALDVLLEPGQMWAAVLTFAGTFVTLVASSLAVVRIVRMRFTILQMIGAAIALQFLSTLVSGAMLIGEGRSFAQSMFLAASAFGNSGLTLGPVPAAAGWRTLFVLLPLSIAGGLSLPVLMELIFARPLSNHSRIVLKMTVLVFALATFECIWLAWPVDAKTTWQDAFATGLIANFNSRTAGLPLQPVYQYPRAIQWLTLLLMGIGAASAGTAGGLKITTVYELFRGGDRALRGEPSGRSLGIALSWLGIYFLLVFCALLNLLQNQPEMSPDRALFTIVSAASNVGLSHDPLSINSANAYTLSITMLLGRLLPIVVLWWMALTTTDADLAVG